MPKKRHPQPRTPEPLIITSTSPLPNATTGEFYSYIFTATGGTGRLQWRMVAGALPIVMPPGLDLRIPPLGALLGRVELFGTPTEAATFRFVMEVADNAQDENLYPEQQVTKEFELLIGQGNPFEADSAQFLIRRYAAQIHNMGITDPPDLPEATTGVPYSYTFSARGGRRPLQWRMAAGSLNFIMPPGLELQVPPLGGLLGLVELTGTPVQQGTFHFTMEVADNAPAPQWPDQVKKDFTLVVRGLLIQAKSRKLLVEGFPAEATHSSNYFEAEAAYFTLKRFAAQIHNIWITDPPDLPEGTAGVPYSYTFHARGGRRPLQWRMVAGSLNFVMPPGLGLQVPPLGGLLGIVELAGIPAEKGTFHFTMEVADTAVAPSWPDQVKKDFTLVVTGSLIQAKPGKLVVQGFPVEPTISSNSVEAEAALFAVKRFTAQLHDLWITNDPDLPEATAGIPYHYTFTARGGRPPLQWRMVAGSLAFVMPPGLGLEPGADPDTVDLVGIPTEEGTFHFVMEVADKEVFPGWPDQVQKVFSLFVKGSLIQAKPGKFIVRGFPIDFDTSSWSFKASSAEFLIERAAAWLQRDLYITSESPLPAAIAGVPYSYIFTARGGERRLQWRMVAGTIFMPPGLGLRIPPLGALLGIVELYGTPTQSGNYNFVMEVADNAQFDMEPPYQKATKAFALTVTGALLDTTPGKFVVRGFAAEMEVFPKRHEAEVGSGNFVVQGFPAEIEQLFYQPHIDAETGNFIIQRPPAEIEYVPAPIHELDAETGQFVVRRVAAELDYTGAIVTNMYLLEALSGEIAIRRLPAELRYIPLVHNELVARTGMFTIQRAPGRLMWLWASAPGGEEPPNLATSIGFSGTMSTQGIGSDMILG